MATFRLLFSYKGDDFFYSDEIKRKGYLNAIVEINAEYYYEVVFYSFEEIDYVRKNGGYFFAEAGMILISELSKNMMLKALSELYDRTMFFRESKLWPAEKYQDYREANF